MTCKQRIAARKVLYNGVPGVVDRLIAVGVIFA
jgi:hypothetical protein